MLIASLVQHPGVVWVIEFRHCEHRPFKHPKGLSLRNECGHDGNSQAFFRRATLRVSDKEEKSPADQRRCEQPTYTRS